MPRILDSKSSDHAIKVLSSRYFKLGYECRTEEVRHESSPQPVIMKSSYDPSGKYIGDWGTAHFLFKKKGIRFVDYSRPSGNVCTVGFNPLTKTWYGWSHRAIFGFKIGMKMFNPRFGDDKTHFSEHGLATIETLADARESAERFARSVG